MQCTSCQKPVPNLTKRTTTCQKCPTCCELECFCPDCGGELPHTHGCKGAPGMATLTLHQQNLVHKVYKSVLATLDKTYPANQAKFLSIAAQLAVEKALQAFNYTEDVERLQEEITACTTKKREF